MKDKQLAEEIVKILDKYNKDESYGIPELMNLFKAQRQELKKKVEEGFDEMFGDSSIKLSTGQPLMQFKKNVNYYLVKDFIINLLQERKK